MRQDHIRNFCIVAHIDHGKSTLADRLIELTGTLDKRLMREQVLDTMDLERERGITIKLNAVRMSYHAKNGQLFELNLIDTPGHVDFTYEVSRSLAACEGAILVVDASQGIQAQTLSNLLLAMDAGLEIIPVLNKIDLPGAEPDKRAHEVDEVGYLQLGHKPAEQLEAGEVGYLVANVRGVREIRPGDTVFDAEHRDIELLPGYRDIQSMVFAGLYPTNPEQYEELRDSLAKLQLNDSSLHYQPETSVALGFGFRCGFLGLLHMEIVRERLEREFDLDLLVTAPTVAYRVKEKNGDWQEVHNPAEFPREVEEVEEPSVKASIIVPKEFVGAVMELCNDRRGTFDHMEYLSPLRVHLTYDLPLGEIVLDFYDQLKSRTRGYASFDYDLAGFRPGNLVRVDVLVGGDPVDALSLIS